ncbi:MAG TPA: His-Xaa-Ser system radical SAM maturase HxsC [Tepidisphaeraceae bacterium]|nr:His-Xaa-Ser system radical SAM maturase HxsC [Tepidisphaeraceae bacterium]
MAVRVPESLEHLTDGDIVRVNPRGGEIWVMYRRRSRFNSMLLTERCNSNCVMCSQPPKDADDGFLIEEFLKAIPLMDLATPELGITGGEPTLLGAGLLRVIHSCKNHLPDTALHMLSNGRRCSDLSFCRELARAAHPDFVIGIPLYADVASRHDFVVQAAGAFDETVRGMMNLARCGLRLELRVVLHRGTVERLPQLARFIARNLPFVEHVALMGLEVMGYVRMNLETLWIDPVEYQPALRRAVEELDSHDMNVSIYNHQLCTLDPALWPFACRSISDWKNEYLPECDGCAALAQCGGFFSSSQVRRSDFIRRIGALPVAG